MTHSLHFPRFLMIWLDYQRLNLRTNDHTVDSLEQPRSEIQNPSLPPILMNRKLVTQLHLYWIDEESAEEFRELD
jgi:hypothetical protein